MDDIKREQIKNDISRNNWLIHDYEVRIKLLQEAVNDLEKRLLDE